MSVAIWADFKMPTGSNREDDLSGAGWVDHVGWLTMSTDLRAHQDASVKARSVERFFRWVCHSTASADDGVVGIDGR